MMKVIYYGIEEKEIYSKESLAHGYSLHHPEETAKDKINNPDLYIKKYSSMSNYEIVVHEENIEDSPIKIMHRNGDRLLLNEKECNVFSTKYDPQNKILKIYTDYVCHIIKADYEEYEKIKQQVIADGKASLEVLYFEKITEKKWYQFWK